MGELTHEHLTALGDRLEGSFRREVDHLRADVKEDFHQVHARLDAADGRVGKTEQSLGGVKEDTRVLRHDFNNHLQVHALTAPRRVPAMGKGKMAAVAAAALAGLTGLSELSHAVATAVKALIGAAR